MRMRVWWAAAAALALVGCHGMHGHGGHGGPGGPGPGPGPGASAPGERDLNRPMPVRVDLANLKGPGGPLPIIDAEPLVFSFDQISRNRAELAKSGALSADGNRLIVRWQLPPRQAPMARIEVRIVAQEPLGTSEAWDSGAARLSERLRNRRYCDPQTRPVAECKVDSSGTACEIDARTRSVFKYEVRVYAPGSNTPQSCLDPWGVIN